MIVLKSDQLGCERRTHPGQRYRLLREHHTNETLTFRHEKNSTTTTITMLMHVWLGLFIISWKYGDGHVTHHLGSEKTRLEKLVQRERKWREWRDKRHQHLLWRLKITIITARNECFLHSGGRIWFLRLKVRKKLNEYYESSTNQTTKNTANYFYNRKKT